jgi:hypothetical protein
MKKTKARLDKNLHKALAIWAAGCAGHVLPCFEKEFPKDKRPRKAIKALRTWVRTGIFRMADVRKSSLDAHAAARRAPEDSAARFAARSAGQAMACAHVPEHAIAAAWYAVKAAKAAGRGAESAWQYKHLPKRLRAAVKLILKKKHMIL